MAVIVCPICSTRYRVTDAQLSKASRLKCKKCKTVFPVSDNIRDEDMAPEPDLTGPAAPPPPPSGGLDFPGAPAAEAPDDEPEAPQASAPAESMTLDFNFTPGTGPSVDAPTLDFSFSAAKPEPDEDDEAYEDDEEEDVEIGDHIADSFHTDTGEIRIGGEEAPDADGFHDEGETTLSMDGSGGSSLDFSFDAVLPDAPAEGQDADESAEGPPDLNFGDIPDDATMTMSDTPAESSTSMDLDISLTGPGGLDDDGGAEDAYADEQADEEAGDGEPLEPCCVDSLAMGMTTCELCGRDLQGVESQRFMQQRREELREGLAEGESQIGFSAEGDQPVSVPGVIDEDFSDVERALDALADGSFEKEIKKRETKKSRGKRLKIIGAGLVAGIVLVVGLGVLLLPSSHERLVGQYEELMAQPEADPAMVVELFLEAAAKNDQDIFQRIAVMPSMPDITSGSVETVGDEYEPTSLGHLGQDVADLEARLTELQTAYEQTEQQWQEASAVDLSPSMIQGKIDQLLQKQANLQADFDEAEQESLQKTLSLQAEIQAAREELEENRLRAQEYLDATDEKGKAMYTASVRKQQSLSDTINKLEGLLTDEQLSHAERMDRLEAEYAPQFEKIANDLEVQRQLLDKALLYADSEKSPLIVLDEELKTLQNTIAETEETLAQKREQLDAVFGYFKRPERRQQVEQHRNEAEFAHVSRNVVASIKFSGSGKREVPVALKRYQAIVDGQTIQGDWVVEALLR